MIDFTYPLTAIRDNGETIVAVSPEQAAAFNYLRPGPKHVESVLWISAITRAGPVWRKHTIHHEWIVRDHHGAVVLHEDLPRTNAPRHGWLRRRLLEAREAAERGLPIPGTGVRRRYRHGYRTFRFNIAMRAAEAALRDDLAEWGVPTARVGRIRSHTLPQVCDDVQWRSDRSCWKNYRRTQWRDRK